MHLLPINPLLITYIQNLHSYGITFLYFTYDQKILFLFHQGKDFVLTKQCQCVVQCTVQGKNVHGGKSFHSNEMKELSIITQRWSLIFFGKIILPYPLIGTRQQASTFYFKYYVLSSTPALYKYPLPLATVLPPNSRILGPAIFREFEIHEPIFHNFPPNSLQYNMKKS